MDIVLSEKAAKDNDEVLVAKASDPENINNGQLIKTLKADGKNAYLNICKNPSREQIGKNIDLAYGFEEQERSDFMHHRNSGLNHILCNILKDKNIMVGFDHSLILNNPHKAHVYLGRMKQNVKLCRKYAIPMVVLSLAKKKHHLKTPDMLDSFARVIGMNEQEIMKSHTLINERMVFNDLKNRGLADEGIRAVK